MKLRIQSFMRNFLLTVFSLFLLAGALPVLAQDDDVAQEDEVHQTPTTLAQLLSPEGIEAFAMDSYLVMAVEGAVPA